VRVAATLSSAHATADASWMSEFAAHGVGVLAALADAQPRAAFHEATAGHWRTREGTPLLPGQPTPSDRPPYAWLASHVTNEGRHGEEEEAGDDVDMMLPSLDALSEAHHSLNAVFCTSRPSTLAEPIPNRASSSSSLLRAPAPTVTTTAAPSEPYSPFACMRTIGRFHFVVVDSSSRRGGSKSGQREMCVSITLSPRVWRLAPIAKLTSVAICCGALLLLQLRLGSTSGRMATV
jgi:hypothetical protein